jgi:uncharacterized protein (TIGR02118 family)
MFRVSALYVNGSGSRFDAAYYREKHEPFATGLLKPFGLREIRTTIGLSAIDGAPPPFWAISEMVFGSREEFDAAMATCGERLFADIPNYTNVTPELQVSQLGVTETTGSGA